MVLTRCRVEAKKPILETGEEGDTLPPPKEAGECHEEGRFSDAASSDGKSDTAA